VSANAEREDAASLAAEEILRTIYGDDLEGCAVSLDAIAGVIRDAMRRETDRATDVTELHEKGFEAVQLLSTPPPDGDTLSAEELRSLLGERLDKIREVSTQIIAATRTVNVDE
jgi:hypothetical protein